MGGIVDAITGGPQRDAARSADKAAANQKEVIDRIVKLFDTSLGKVQGLEAGGTFDPNKQIALADEQSAQNETRKRTADAGTARVLGYRPGDTKPLTQDRGTSEQFDLQRRLQNFGIRQQSSQNLLNAYNSIQPGGLQGAANSFGQQQQMYQQQASQPNPLLQAATTYATMGGFSGGGGGGFDAGFSGTRPGQFYRG